MTTYPVISCKINLARLYSDEFRSARDLMDNSGSYYLFFSVAVEPMQYN